MKKLLQTCLVIVTASIILSGCATYDMIKPAPMQAQPIRVVYTSEGPSGFTDLPIGVYRVPDSQVIVAGYNRGGGAGLLFGIVGVLAQDAIETQSGKSAVKDVVTVLHVKLADQAQAISNSLVGSGQFGKAFISASSSDALVLSVDPFLVINYVSETDVRPFVVLKATLLGPMNKKIWASRYISSIDKAHPLEGDQSYTAQDGAMLKAAIARELETAIKAMLADVASPHIRDEGKLIYTETTVPFFKGPVGLVGYPISDDDQSVVVALKIPDALVFAGVHVLDKSVTTYRAATGDDKFKIVK